MTTYEQHKHNALQLFRTATSFAQQAKYKDYVKLLQEAAQRLDEGKFIVVVCGEFKRGKSSLLNAFLNELQDLFPVDIGITTNLVSTISYAPTEKIVVLLGEPDSDKMKEIHIKRDEIRNYVTEQDNPHNAREARLMVIETPNEQLKQGLVLVDTPGVGGLNVRHTDATYEFIPNADAILFVTHALEPLSEEDLKFIRERILRHTQHIIFVLTKKDKKRDYKVVMENDRDKLTVTLGRPANAITIIPVSSTAKRDYLKSHDPEDLEDSNFPQLENTLWQFIGAHRGRILIAKALTTLGQVVGDMRRPLQVEFDTCREQNQQKLDELASSLEEARDYLQRLQEDNAQWQTQLRDGLVDIRDGIQHQFDRGFADIRRNAEGYLYEDGMLEQPERVLDPIQRDINDLLYSLDRSLREEAADLQGRIEHATGLSLNPFEPDSLQQHSKALTLQGMPPAPKQDSSWDDMVVTGQRANSTGTFAGRVIGWVGRIIGGIFGHPWIGGFIGEGIGWLVGARSGARQSMRQLREQDRQHVTRHLMVLLADSQREHSQHLAETVKRLERAMRDDLLDQIKREKRSRERALKSFQETRNLTAAEADARIAILKGPLQQLDQLQHGIETLGRAIMKRDDNPPANGNADTGGWADE